MRRHFITATAVSFAFSISAFAGFPWATPFGDNLSAANVNELKAVLDTKRIECGFPAHVWQSDVASSKQIKAGDIEEIRDVYTETAEAEKNKFRSTLKDFKILPKVTKITKIHVTELRAAIDNIDCAIVSTPSATDCKTLTCPPSHPFVIKAPLDYIQGNDPFLCMVLNKGGTSIYVRDGDNCKHSGASGNMYCGKKKPADPKTVIQRSQINGGARRFLNCDTEPQSGYCTTPDIDFCLNPLVGDETVLDSTVPVKKFSPFGPFDMNNNQNPKQAPAPLNDG
ncbi:MAG: hypothetical protein JNM39_15320 [Bdellovibrionaceae bacterium]|nr:hypothetical protein [Pseudobdellovibrionaceae bacterium]